MYDISPPVNDKPILEHRLHTGNSNLSSSSILIDTNEHLQLSDAIGSVSTHPFHPWILTAYGSRQPSSFERSLDDSSESGIESDGSEDSESDDSNSMYDIESPNSDTKHADLEPVAMAQPSSANHMANSADFSRQENQQESSAQPSNLAATIRSHSPVSARGTEQEWIGGVVVSTLS